MPTVVSCQCGQSFEAADFLDGRVVPCPVCGQALTVLAKEEEFVDSVAVEPVDRIPVNCRCGKRFKALPKLWGTVVPCPACGNQLRVERAPAVASQLMPMAPTTFDASQGNNRGGLGQTMPLGKTMPHDQYSAPYLGQAYGGVTYDPGSNNAPTSRRGGSFELGPRAIAALITVGVGAIVLMLIAITLFPPRFAR